MGVVAENGCNRKFFKWCQRFEETTCCEDSTWSTPGVQGILIYSCTFVKGYFCQERTISQSKYFVRFFFWPEAGCKNWSRSVLFVRQSKTETKNSTCSTSENRVLIFFLFLPQTCHRGAVHCRNHWFSILRIDSGSVASRKIFWNHVGNQLESAKSETKS